MNTSLLPIDVCERIIDNCYCRTLRRNRYASKFSAYTTWCQTALVCTDWLPRSRFNLFYEVELSCPSDVDLLLCTLSANTPLADLIVRLSVFAHYYVPFARPPLPRLLRSCTSLKLRLYPQACPRRYIDTSLFQLSVLGIVELDIMLLDSRELVCAQFRFVWSLPMLRKLEVWGAREARKTSVLLTRKPFGCANLKTLVLMKCNGAITLPPFAFGESVVDLFVDTRRSLGNILESIQCFRRLESLSFCVRLDGHDHGASPNTSGRPEQDACGSRTETLRAVLQSVRLATGTLHTLKLHVVTSDVHVSSPTNSPYGDERDEFLDALFDKQIVDLFDSFPMLRLLKFTLEENNRLYDPEWWREKIVERLPSRLHPAVMVHIDLEDGSASPTLWSTIVQRTCTPTAPRYLHNCIPA